MRNGDVDERQQTSTPPEMDDVVKGGGLPVVDEPTKSDVEDECRPLRWMPTTLFPIPQSAGVHEKFCKPFESNGDGVSIGVDMKPFDLDVEQLEESRQSIGNNVLDVFS